MTFTHPGWLQLGWLAVPIVALYLYRRRRRPVEIPSLLLWEWAKEQEARRPLWGRMRDPLSLLAQFLVLALATLAAAGPTTDDPGPPGERWAIVIDASPAMRAEGGAGRPGFAAAVERTNELLARASGLDRVALVTAGRPARLLAGPDADDDTRRRALAAARPESDADAADDDRWEGARRVALDALGGDADRWIVLSDRPEEFRSLVPASGFRDIRVGGVGENVAIVDVSAEIDPATLETVVRLSIESAGRTATDRTIVAEGPGAPREPIVVELDANERVERTIRLRPEAAGVVRIRFESADGLPDDDFVEVPVEPMPRVRLLVDDPRGLPPFFAEAVRALGDLVDAQNSAVVDGSRLGPNLPERSVLVRRGDDLPTTLRTGGVLLLDAPGGDERTPAVVTTVASDHPVLRSVPLANLGVLRGRVRSPGDGETVLLAAEGGALMTAVERGGVRAIRVGFALSDSNFAVLSAFPLWLRGALRWLGGDPRTLVPPLLREGEALEPLRPLDPSIDRVHVGGPAAGGLIEVPVRDGRFRFEPPRSARENGRDLFVRIGGRRQPVRLHSLRRRAVSLGAIGVGEGSSPVPDRSDVVAPDRDLRPLFVALLAAALLAEWWLFNRGAT